MTSIQFHLKISLINQTKCNKNKGNDHQLKKFTMFKQILLVSSLVNVQRTVWRIWTLMLGCNGFISGDIAINHKLWPNLIHPSNVPGLKQRPCPTSWRNKSPSTSLSTATSDKIKWKISTNEKAIHSRHHIHLKGGLNQCFQNKAPSSYNVIPVKDFCLDKQI